MNPQPLFLKGRIDLHSEAAQRSYKGRIDLHSEAAQRSYKGRI